MIEDFALSVTANSINTILKAINESFHGKKKEIEDIENALAMLDKEILEKLSKQSPEEILKYISQKIDLKIKIEELKLKKGSTFWHLIKSWTPFLAPFVAAVLTFVGVLVGANITNTSNDTTESERIFEQKIIIDVMAIEPIELQMAISV